MSNLKRLVTLGLSIIFITVNVKSSDAQEANLHKNIRVGLLYKYGEVDEVPIFNKSITIGTEVGGVFVATGNLTAVTNFVVKQGAEKDRLVIYDGINEVIRFGATEKVQVKDFFGGNITLGKEKAERTYRGVMEFGVYSGKKITAVNVVSISEYLYSVVPSEMPASWHVEALKAQAVAARNYVITNMDKHKKEGFNVCDGVHCQVYKGLESENISTTKAVDETTDKLVYYYDKPINATFFSSSGGVTQNSEDVWSAHVDYLRGVDDSREVGGRLWIREVKKSDLEFLTKNAIGKISGLEITGKSVSGAVSELTVYGETGNKVLKKEEIRTFFSGIAGGSLESRNFTLESGLVSGGSLSVSNAVTKKVISSNVNASLLGNGGFETTVISELPNTIKGEKIHDGFIIKGRGWGHGVGMSQYGAKSLAEIGYNYEQILQYYYSGSVVK